MFQFLVIIVVNDFAFDFLLEFITDFNMSVCIATVQFYDAMAATHWVQILLDIYFVLFFRVEYIKLALYSQVVRREDSAGQVDLVANVGVVWHFEQLLYHHSSRCVENVVDSLLFSFEIACALRMVLFIP